MRDPRPQADAERGSVVSSFTENVDIMPTMLEAIGAEIPVQCDGASLAPFLHGAGRPDKWRSEAHWEFDFRDPADDSAERELGITMHQCTMNIVRGERYKYVHFTNLPPLFFDLKKDPDEFVNLARAASYAPIVSGVRAKAPVVAHESRRANPDPHRAKRRRPNHPPLFTLLKLLRSFGEGKNPAWRLMPGSRTG